MRTEIDQSPLRTFRFGFGLMMCASILRFWANGWIEKLYLEPEFFFSYPGFAWVKPLGSWTYLLFAVAGLTALCIAFNRWYRPAAILFFLSFTYVELMDKTTYLNHYYFISLLGFILIFLPGGRNQGSRGGPAWPLWALRIMVAVVYFYAGLAKLNSDWLLEAMPLKIWLPAKYGIPLLGDLLQQNWVHYAFSWSGAAYDLLIPFLLLYRPTRPLAFVLVVVFHVLTRVLFPIGMFPYVMIVSALIFFEPETHARWWRRVDARLPRFAALFGHGDGWHGSRLIVGGLLLFHLVFPWRYLVRPGELFWNEDGYRYSWRVMLMEKAGLINFRVVDLDSGEKWFVDNHEILTTFQEKQMSTQPDFILEFAKYLGDRYRKEGHERVGVFADSYVALNGRASQLYVNPEVDLYRVSPAAPRAEWLMPFIGKIDGL